MAFAAVADAVHYNDGSGIWYWGPALIVVAGVSSLLRRAATLRLTANGYLRRVKRVVVAATTVMVLLTAVLSAFLAPRLVGTVNGQTDLVVALEFLGFNGLFLAGAWLLPPRWPTGRRRSSPPVHTFGGFRCCLYLPPAPHHRIREDGWRRGWRLRRRYFRARARLLERNFRIRKIGQCCTADASSPAAADVQPRPFAARKCG